MAFLKKTWDFIWHEDSIASWLVNLVLAFVLVKWVIYPGLGLLLGTSFPIVAVVSGSMEHEGMDFNAWWEHSGQWYEDKNISKDEFSTYRFKNGFQKGDIMILMGAEPKDIKVGDVIVYESLRHNNPIIHRVVEIDGNNEITFRTKGDHNGIPDDEVVTSQQIARTGKAIQKLPYLGWIKIWFVSLAGLQ